MTAPKMTTKALLEALRNHYIEPGSTSPGGVFAAEVGHNGSFGQSSRCDALYAGFTSASGRILVGHELKVSRADWRHELEQADKADYWADQCHAWMIVAPNTEIVPPGEVPHGWGLMVPNPRAKRRFEVVIRPEIHKDRVPSWEAVRSMMSRLDTLRAAEMDAIIRERVARDVEEQIATRQRRDSGAQELDRMRKRLSGYEDAIGVNLGGKSPWECDASPDELKAAILIVKDLRRNGSLMNLRWQHEELKNAVGAVERAMAVGENIQRLAGVEYGQ